MVRECARREVLSAIFEARFHHFACRTPYLVLIHMDIYIDPHFHAVSRTTDDYEAMRAAGIVAIIEPAFLAWSTPNQRNLLPGLF